MANKKAIIIGAGPGGLCSAIFLRRIGFSVRIFERGLANPPSGAGLALWPNALLSLPPKLAQTLASRGAPLDLLIPKNPKGTPLSQVPLGPWSKNLGAQVICISRNALLQTLQEQIPPEDITYQTAFDSFIQEENSIRVKFSNQTEESCDLLLGADGLRSLVRKQLLGEETLRYAGRTSWRGMATFSSPLMPPGTSSETLGGKSRFGLFPVAPGRVYWYLTRNGPPSTVTGIAPKEELLSIVNTWASPTPEVIEATLPGDIIQTDIYDRPPAPFWTKGHATLLGDAAHPMTPDLGQGACQAIEDAACLSYHLQREANIPGALAKFQAERLPRTSQLIKRAAMMGKARQLENPILRTLRDSIMRITPTRIGLAQLAPAAAFRAPWQMNEQ